MPTLTRLWLGMLLAPAAWVASEGVGYYVAARSCELGVGGVPLIGTARPLLTQALLSGVAIVVAIVGLLVALSNYRALGGRPRAEDPLVRGRARFMAYGGVLLSVLFIGGILLFGLPTMFVNACSQAR